MWYFELGVFVAPAIHFTPHNCWLPIELIQWVCERNHVSARVCMRGLCVDWCDLTTRWWIAYAISYRAYSTIATMTFRRAGSHHSDPIDKLLIKPCVCVCMCMKWCLHFDQVRSPHMTLRKHTRNPTKKTHSTCDSATQPSLYDDAANRKYIYSGWICRLTLSLFTTIHKSTGSNI